MIIRALTGTMAFIFIPGAFLTHRLLPTSVESLTTYGIVGLVSGIICIQFGVFTYIISGIMLPLNIWLTLLCSLIVSVCYIDLRRITQQQDDFRLRAGFTRDILIVIVLAFFLRLCLAAVTTGMISPDGALYSDFARGIVNGQFQSSIINDDMVLHTDSGVELTAHGGFVYITALSFLLVEPQLSGPSYILTIIGSLLIGPVAQISRQLFGRDAALWTSAIVAIHPLYLVYSAVAYGPEISSLTLFMFMIQLLFSDISKAITWPTAGVILGCIAAVWLPNYYIAVITIPLMLNIVYTPDNKRTLALICIGVLVIISRQTLDSVMIYSLIWTAILTCVCLSWFIRPQQAIRLVTLLIGLVVTEIFWQSPALLTGAGEGMNTPETDPLIQAIFTMVSAQLAIQFLFFLVFHASIVIMVIAVSSLLRSQSRRMYLQLMLIDVIVIAGTLKVFSLFKKEVLLLQYLYSDGRFFLFIILCPILIVGGVLRSKNILVARVCSIKTLRSERRCHYYRPTTVFLLLCLGLVPGYAMIPSGLSLVDIKTRYGWDKIQDLTKDINHENPIFLVDRAREFSWCTSRLSVAFSLPQQGIPNVYALDQLLETVKTYNVTHVIIDRYTIAHWQTLYCLYWDKMTVNTQIPLNASAILKTEGERVQTIDVLTFVDSTQDLDEETYVRLFSIERGTFSIVHEIDLLTSGWSTGGTGQITNRSCIPAIELSEGNMTFTYRPAYDLNISLNGGMLVFDIEEEGARVERVEIWDTKGQLIRYAERIGELFVCLCGEVVIGDVRIVVVGEPGGYVLVNSCAIWGPQS